ncbi:hypothetical protein PHLGIDRAFT_99429 [Phlebiopsis gigantea 11061_1 CR5-6]|uniref:Glycopeptide n=1 Tax=Phlebiopsis gigantea (strain 11061_1 CR5-6) TaxID=745531 RepID=A0A0C3SD91_PHLG1|nr:hypothetical protein PHLGIDRAFT_99429 [Phlebiopsis gigantea 11061_1 CR5-6]
MAPTLVKVFLGLALALSATSAVSAESHTVKFDNQCGKGTPTLIIGGKVVSTGDPFTSNGAISGGIAYLQTGGCGFNGEDCTLMEMTLGNPTCPGCGSSTDISLITPHAFNVESSFSYYGGCDGQGTTCDSESCDTAFHQPNDNQVQVQCEEDNVNLLITFCGSSGSSPASSSVATSQAAATATSSHVAPSSSSPAATTEASAASSSVASSSVASSSVVSSTASAPSASATVNRQTCKAKRAAKAARDSLDELTARSDREARELYGLHERRHRATARAHRRSH